MHSIFMWTIHFRDGIMGLFTRTQLEITRSPVTGSSHFRHPEVSAMADCVTHGPELHG